MFVRIVETTTGEGEENKIQTRLQKNRDLIGCQDETCG